MLLCVVKLKSICLVKMRAATGGRKITELATREKRSSKSRKSWQVTFPSH